MILDEEELQKVVVTMMCNRYSVVRHAISVINKAIETVCSDYGYDAELFYSQILRELIKDKED